jgi:hypothetical protein
VSVATSTGGTAQVTSNADASSSGGQPASATVVGIGAAGQGETTVVDCSLAAQNEELAK